MFMPTQFEIHSEVTSDGARASVSGELDLATVPTLRAAVEALLEQGVSKILLELSALAFVDSSGLSLLVELNNRSLSEGWALRLTRPTGRVFSVFTITGADANLPFVDGPDSK
jgi:anti-anti-sigma factor